MKKTLQTLLLFVLLACCLSCNSVAQKTTWYNVEKKTLKVSLEGNATTGYTWSAVPDNSGVFEIVSEQYTPSYETGLIGSGGIYTAEIKAKKPGKGSIKFQYKRNWESSPIEERTLTIRAFQNLRLYISSAE